MTLQLHVGLCYLLLLWQMTVTWEQGGRQMCTCACEHTHVTSVARGSHSGLLTYTVTTRAWILSAFPAPVHSLCTNQCFLFFSLPSTYYVPGTVVGTEYILVEQTRLSILSRASTDRTCYKFNISLNNI